MVGEVVSGWMSLTVTQVIQRPVCDPSHFWTLRLCVGICNRAIALTSFQNSQPSRPIATSGMIACHHFCTPMRYSEKKTICRPRIVSKPRTAQYWRASMPKPATSSSAVVTAVATDGSPVADEMSLPVRAVATLAIAKTKATIAANVTTPGRSPGASGTRFARISSSRARPRA